MSNEKKQKEDEELLERLGHEAERIALIHAVCGKYRSVPTSSEAFAAAKAEEIELENRPQ